MFNKSLDWKKNDFTIAVVPTMGCLHAGHLSLVRRAKELADKVVTTIFVNPLQFGPNEDLDDYPRQMEQDSKLLDAEGVDCLFCPQSQAMYPDNFQTVVRVEKLARGMCGNDRPGHFDGVATVVTKLFNLIQPDFGLFGEKDFQQLTLVRQMVEDLNYQVKIVGCPIVREEDGLAMSSINKYLLAEDREQALSLSKSIAWARQTIATSQTSLVAEKIIREVAHIINSSGAQLDYAVIVHGDTLQPEKFVGRRSVLAVAAKIKGRVRLIDNGLLMI